MQRKLNELFGIPVTDAAVVDVRENVVGPVPQTDPNYVFDVTFIKKLLMWTGPKTPRKNLMLVGDAGVGKTSVVLEYAGRMGIPVWGVSCSGKTRFEHLVGSMSLVAGNTQFVDGPLLAAMRSGGIFLANEISRMDPGEQMRLVDVLDRRARLTIGDTGEVVEPHPDFRFAATGNSGGFGDSTGAYPGERVGSYAFADRFMKLHVKPMSEEMELRLLERVAPALSESYRKGMVKLATGVRSAFVGAGGCCRITITPRSLIDWAMLACEYRRMSGIDPLRESLLDIVVNGAPKDDQDVVMEVFDAWMKETGTA